MDEGGREREDLTGPDSISNCEITRDGDCVVVIRYNRLSQRDYWMRQKGERRKSGWVHTYLCKKVEDDISAHKGPPGCK
jgi:hypothetical protein